LITSTNTRLPKVLATAPSAMHPQSLTPVLAGLLILALALIPHSTISQLMLMPTMFVNLGTITLGKASSEGYILLGGVAGSQHHRGVCHATCVCHWTLPLNLCGGSGTSCMS
jgi:hypothetical protein